MKAASPSRIGAIVGDLATVEEMFALKGLIGKLGSPNIDCRQDGSKLHPKFGRASYLFNSTIAGVDQADAILVIGSNPRREAAGAQRAHPQALAEGRRADGPHRRAGRPDLQVQLPRRRAGDARPGGGEAAGGHDEADVHRRRRGLRAARRRGGAGEPRQGGARRGRRQGRLERLQRAAQRRVPRRRPRSRPRAGRGRPRRAVHGEGGRARRALQSRRGRDRRRARRLRRLYRHARRPRRAPRRRHPAGRGLHREDRHLRQHRGPAAVRRARGVPAGRRARGLVDPARAFRPARREAAVRFAGAIARDARRRLSPSRALRRDRAGGPGGDRRPVDGGRDAVDKAPFASAIHDFYLTNPIARASRTMAECSALAQGHARQAAE